MITAFDIAMNALATLIVLVAVASVVARVMELRGLGYTLTKTPNGLHFQYNLGIYAGVIDLIRDDTVTSPQITSGVRGWDCRFPVYFTVKEMCEFIRITVRNMANKGSHSKDLLIFNEIVNCKNDALVSLNCNVYTYDNSSCKPFL